MASANFCEFSELRARSQIIVCMSSARQQAHGMDGWLQQNQLILDNLRYCILRALFRAYLLHKPMGHQPEYVCCTVQRMPPFTLEAQRWIWDRQNPDPSSCSSQKYLMGIGGERQGLGSSLHVAAALLGNALQFDHIFMWLPSGQFAGDYYVDQGCGRNESYTNFNCLFERPTVCSDEHANVNNTVWKGAFTGGACTLRPAPHYTSKIDHPRLA